MKKNNLNFRGKPVTETLEETALCIAEGLSNQEIAAKLFLSQKAVETRVKKLNRLFGLPIYQSQRKLVLLCLELKSLIEKIKENNQ